MYVVIGYNTVSGVKFNTAYNNDDDGTVVFKTLEEANFCAKSKTRNASNKHVIFYVHKLWEE